MLATMAFLANSAPSGAFVEVGVYLGGSAEVLYEVAQKQRRRLYLYDTFSGIPFADEIDSHRVGDFGVGASFEATQAAFPDAVVQKGIFPRDQAIPDSIAFVHLDVDQYRSYRECLDTLLPRMVRGGMILCDDYCLGGAAKAIDETKAEKELLPDNRILFRT